LLLILLLLSIQINGDFKSKSKKVLSEFYNKAGNMPLL